MLNAILVDDEEDICDFLKDHLEALDFSVVTTVSGELALKMIDQKEIHLALVDLRLLTAVTGLDVIRCVQQKWPKAVVIAMSGYVDIGLRQETGKAGVHGYFVKPDDVQPSVFKEKIKMILEENKKKKFVL
ncbi:MAG: response regulator [Candidatus Omnitrophica bacterium]|nr:response regulator [Candidatus Omnitrophota bacterium]